MVVDSSALLAILLREPDWSVVLDVLNAAEAPVMAAPTWLETCLVFDNRATERAARHLDELVHQMRIEVVPFDAEAAAIARSVHRIYGRGSKHKAHLNFGDCIAYALAKGTDQPLLFKGDDFTHTDIIPAMP